MNSSLPLSLSNASRALLRASVEPRYSTYRVNSMMAASYIEGLGAGNTPESLFRRVALYPISSN